MKPQKTNVFKIQIRPLSKTAKFYEVSLLPADHGLYVVFPFSLDCDPQFIKESIIKHVMQADVYMGKKKVKNESRN